MQSHGSLFSSPSRPVVQSWAPGTGGAEHSDVSLCERTRRLPWRAQGCLLLTVSEHLRHGSWKPKRIGTSHGFTFAPFSLPAKRSRRVL